MKNINTTKNIKPLKGKIFRNGFTLVELMVVIAIFGLLIMIVVMNISSARKSSRDAQRKADLNTIRIALQTYKEKYGTYPPHKSSTNCGGSDAWANSSGTCGGEWLTTDANFYTILEEVPVDPLNTGVNAGLQNENYVYSYFPTTRNYNLIAQLENIDDLMACKNKITYYYDINNVPPNPPWCEPWANNLGRSQNIISDH